MASEVPTSPTLDPQLYEDWDDEDDRRWKDPLDALIKGTQTPLQAAQNIDNLLRAETSDRLQKLNNYANSHNLTAEERESGDWGGLRAPNASVLAKEVLRSYCRLCTAFSPYSRGQNQLVEFLEELRNLPRWMGPESRPDEHGNVHESEFWAFGYGWLGLEDEFRRLHVEVKPSYYRDTAARNRWRNFQHAMARITASNLIYCAPWNALQDLVPSGEPSGKRSLEYDIVAAAQWVIWPNECRYVYQECLKRESTDRNWDAWSKERWSQWRRELELIVENAQYDNQTKSVAGQALQRMKDIEEEVSEEGSVGSQDS